MRRSTILLLLALLALPVNAPADPEPGPIDVIGETLRRNGFSSLYLPGEHPSWVSVELLPMRADLDGDGTEEIFTKDRRDVEYHQPTLTARRNGLPLWSVQVDDYAWAYVFEDVTGDGGNEVLVYQRGSERVSVFNAVDFTTVGLEMLDGRSGRVLWSYQQHMAGVSPITGPGVTAGTDFWPQVMSDANGDDLNDVLIVGHAEPPLDAVPQLRACGIDGRTGVRADRCVTIPASGGTARVLAVPDASGDGLADVITYAKLSGDRHVLRMFTATGESVWGRPVDSRYAWRWPDPDYRAGDRPGRILFGPACTMLGCTDQSYDAFDARTGAHLWQRRADLSPMGDIDGDGGSDLGGVIVDEAGARYPAVVCSATGAILYTPTSPALPHVDGYHDPSPNGSLTEDLDGDGVLDRVGTWLYWPIGRHDEPLHLLIAVRGADGSELWRRFTEGDPEAFGGDADGGGTRDLRVWELVTPLQGSKLVLRDGVSYETRWSAGPFGDIKTWREPMAADADGAGGDELILSWYEHDGDELTDNVDYLAAYGSSGRLWKVAITLEGTFPAV